MPDKASIKVLMLGWELPPRISGGLGIACDGLLRGLATVRNLRITFVLPGHEANVKAYPGRVELIELPLLRRPLDGARFSAYDSALLEATEDYAAALTTRAGRLGPFDIIHAHDWLTFPAAVRMKRACGAKLVAHVHSTEFDRASNLRVNRSIVSIERNTLAGADKVVTVSAYTRDIIIEKYGVHPERIRTVYNAGRLRRAGRLQVRQLGKAKTVTFLGRMTYQKGPELFLEVAHRVWSAAPETQFVMAGRGELLELMKSLTTALGMEHVVSFPGFLDAEGVRDLLGRSDVLVMPSISEPFGLVAIEAVEAGVPVVVSNRCGMTECINTATIIDPFDVDAAAEACLDILNDPAFAANLSRMAQREAMSLTWERSARRLMDIYGELLH